MYSERRKGGSTGTEAKAGAEPKDGSDEDEDADGDADTDDEDGRQIPRNGGVSSSLGAALESVLA